MKWISLILVFIALQTKAQSYDNVWLVGYNYCTGCGISSLDFTYGHPDTIALYPAFGVSYTNASICDSTGLLKLYTNGIKVGNGFGQIVPGSVDFNLDSAVIHFGFTHYMPYFQTAQIVPYPGHPNQYCIFHVSGRDYTVFSTTYIQPFRLAYSIVDMNANNGSGQMTIKNQTILNDTLLYSTMQSTKHGNGRDWWVAIHEAKTPGLYAALLSPDSIVTVVRSIAGPVIKSGMMRGQSKFSPDGTMFAIAHNDSSRIYLYNFDRCTGVFTYDTLISHPINNTTNANLASVIFSPNSRFLYVSDMLNVYQYDLYASDIQGSEKLIKANDGLGNNYFRFSYAPDGKIYEDHWGGYRALHVIEDPDQPDTACHFFASADTLKYYGTFIPDFPYFKLGEAYGSLCDSLTNSISENVVNTTIKVFPNPSDGHFKFELNPGVSLMEIRIFDLTGRLLFSLKNITEVDLTAFPAGSYYYDAQTGDQRVVRGILVRY